MLIKKYRQKIINYRDKYNWNYNIDNDIYLSGQGMGDEDRQAANDLIAHHHLSLAQDLEFIRKGMYSWAKNGYILASLSSKENGSFPYNDEKILDKELKKKGFIAKLSNGEKLVFSKALLTKDFDRIIPIMMLLEQYSEKKLIEENYLISIEKWLNIKIEYSISNIIKHKIMLQKRDIDQKISRLHMELEDMKKGKKITHKPKKPSMLLYCREQTSPRLEFLQDIGYVNKKRNKFFVSNLGKSIMEKMINQFDPNKDVSSSSINNEVNLLKSIVDVTCSELKEISYENFISKFKKISKFYTKASTLLLSYYNTYLATASIAIEDNEYLPLYVYDKYLNKLKDQKSIIISTSGRGTKYIKIRVIRSS